MPWPFGRKRDKKTRDKIAETLKGKEKTDSHRIAIGNAQRGKKRGKYRRKDDSEEKP